MLSKYARIRVLLSPNFTKRFIISSSYSTLHKFHPPTTTNPQLPSDFLNDIDPKAVALTFKDWFKSTKYKNALLDRIFEILAPNDDDLDSRRVSELALSRLGLKLSEEFVLKVLDHGKDVLSCLKFFDWAGRQPGFDHSRATFNAIFKILSRAKLMSLMLDFLEKYRTSRDSYKVRFYDTLVLGYAIAGKPHIALQLFGKMRYQGTDLDVFSYHIFLNALIEQSCFDVADVISKQITLRGKDNEITSCLRVKNFVKQKKLEEAKKFVRGLVSEGKTVSDHTLAVLVDALCRRKKFEEAGKLLEDFWELTKVPMPHTYGIWIRDLVKAGEVDGAMKFLRNKQFLEGYLPDVFRYNMLICRLLRQNRLEEVCDLLMEMRERKIFPDKVTMNAALCFFCKAGMVDVALELYNSRSEYGLTLNTLAYNYLINTLCGDGSVDDAYRVLRDSIKQGYFPGKKTFAIIGDALIAEDKLDKMTELMNMAMELKVRPNEATCMKFISALCKARRVEEGYMVHCNTNKDGNVTNRYAYADLIQGFNSLNRGDMASRLLIEMQENGYSPSKGLYRAVIRSVCNMENPENSFFTLLEMQLSHHASNPVIYNFFIDGAGHANKPDLARVVFERMSMSGFQPPSFQKRKKEIEPHLGSKILMLQSYLKSERIADALNFFNDLRKKEYPGRKLYSTIIVGLCKAKKPDLALDLLEDMRKQGRVPSLQCYEEIVHKYALIQNYDMVVKLIQDLEKAGRQISSFIGNILLQHSLNHKQLSQAWIRSGVMPKEAAPSSSLTLGELVVLFSGGYNMDQYLDNLDEVIKQCFPPDIFTYNMWLLKLVRFRTMDYACDLFYHICKKGYKPNQWTYDIIVHGLCKHGRRNDAMVWVDEMYRKGFALSYRTEQLL